MPQQNPNPDLTNFKVLPLNELLFEHVNHIKRIQIFNTAVEVLPVAVAFTLTLSTAGPNPV